ncbi:hypothetical protein SORBI_3001G211700 [Sorghum bicolor]|uniref:BTB domain-containing protein n=1 Tax=Sorghum bicolor TaxID=4558 RepID=A0A1Z5S788_SORBI|nr:hypothetical protein SORBI_3001G211700 [Sorghum bicolor]
MTTTTSDSASAIIEGGSHTGSHLLHVEGYSRTKELPNQQSIIHSESFNVGGRTWRIQYSPRGQGGIHSKHIWLKLVLMDSIDHPYPPRARAAFVFLDQAGNEVPAYTRRVEWNWYAHGGYRFIVLIEREAVEAASPDLVVNDCLKIRCDVAVYIRYRRETRGPSTEGADVTFQVAGEAFRAHRCILAARSPVFKAELFGAMKESTSTGACIRIGDMLPQMGAGQEVVLMAQHLLEAADRYAMQRLKLICEEILCRCLDVNTIASTIVLAEQHSCHRLKEACFVFLKSSPFSLQHVMATSGFEHLIKCFPALLRELISKLGTPCPYVKDSSLQ